MGSELELVDDSSQPDAPFRVPDSANYQSAHLAGPSSQAGHERRQLNLTPTLSETLAGEKHQTLVMDIEGKFSSNAWLLTQGDASSPTPGQFARNCTTQPEAQMKRERGAGRLAELTEQPHLALSIASGFACLARSCTSLLLKRCCYHGCSRSCQFALRYMLSSAYPKRECSQASLFALLV